MNRLLTTVVVGLAGIQGIALAVESRPKLVVGIMVDQLRTDYLEDLKEMFGQGGFRRLMESGIYIKDVDFSGTGGDPASAAAIIQSAAYPRQNGITGAIIYDPATKSLKPIFQDEAFIGNFTNETYSPAALKVSTLTDEISLANKGKGKIHSIAPDAAQAIVLAGHNANSTFWINDETGRWSSTTYYPNPPVALQNQNYNSPLISRLDTIRWMPLRKNEPYPFVDDEEILAGFRYTFPRTDRDVFTLYKHSPFVNRDVTDAAKEYVEYLGLGKTSGTTDVLNLAYTLSPYPAISGDDYRYELQDAYIRLDKDLERLFVTLDRQVGKENVLVYLVSSGYFEEPQVDGSKYRLPGGTFSVKRALSLLNSYLAAKYGNGAFVDQYVNRQIHLSKKEIESKNLKYSEVAQDARDFLVKMSGVADAFTLADILSPTNSKTATLALSVDPKNAGDIFLEFNPGWNIVDDSRYPSVTEVNKTAIYSFPAFISGTGFAPKVVEQPVEATAIAPTLAESLRIRAPNSAISKPIK